MSGSEGCCFEDSLLAHESNEKVLDHKVSIVFLSIDYLMFLRC